jgi:hypothetical protein
MPANRTSTRKRQTKISFSPAAKTSSHKRARAVSISTDDEDGVLPSKPTKRSKFERDTERGMRLGMPSSLSGRGMFGSSDNELDTSSGGSSSDEVSEEGQLIVTRRPRNHTESIEELDNNDKLVSRADRSRGKAKQAKNINEEGARHRKSRRATRQASIPIDESGEDALPTRAGKGHRRRKPIEESDEESSNQVLDDEYDENDELKEDLAFLKSSPLADRGKLRSTHGRPKSQRELALEALKKRRAVASEPSSSATPSRKKPIIIDSESGSDLEVIQEEVYEESEEDEDEKGSEEDEDPEPDIFEVFQENAEDENFIDDDDALIGAPQEHVSIPLQFSSLGRAKPRDLFKYAVEWMVQKKINPAFAADDEIYDLAFKKLNDEVSGLASSKFHSSAWTPDFTRAIRARPEFIVNEIGHHMREVLEPYCEACNRKNHTATWEASLTGKPYHKETLEPLADDTDSSSDNDNDSDSSLSSHASSADLNGEKATYDAMGERLPPESKFFTLGSTCKANAQVAHTLYHWRYHLNSWVVDYLVKEGHCTPEKLVKRDTWTVKKRTKYANKIVDKMEKENEIRKLHRLYKEQVDFALEAKNEFTRGWGRSRG